MKMEENILVESKQYSARKIAIVICAVGIALSLLLALILCFRHWNSCMDYGSEKGEFTHDYEYAYERYQKGGSFTFLNLPSCQHNGWVSSSEKVELTADEFFEIHPSLFSYRWCRCSRSLSADGSFLFCPAILAVSCIFSLVFYLWLSKCSLTITDKRVYGRGAFGKRIDLPVDSISSVGAGALKGISMGTSSGRVKFKLIKNRDEMHKVISELLANRQSRSAAAVPTVTASSASVADELKKYKELLDGGVITQEEFERKKAELLN